MAYLPTTMPIQNYATDGVDKSTLGRLERLESAAPVTIPHQDFFVETDTQAP
jgi:hypothetical protein